MWYKSFYQYFTKKRLKSFSIQIILFLLVLFIIRSYQLSGAAKGEAPIILDTFLSGESVDLKKYRGKPVLIYFWATWCPICKLVNDNIDSIAKDYPVISIAHLPDSTHQVADFMRDNSLSMPVIVDLTGQWGVNYGVRGVPVSFVLDAQGNVRFSELGYATETGLRLRLWWAGK